MCVIQKSLPKWAQKAEHDFHVAILVQIVQDADKKDCRSFAFLCYFEHFDLGKMFFLWVSIEVIS